MFDPQSNTLWNQLYGAEVDGSMAGASLAVFPSLLTEWKIWKSQHPETLVLSKRLTCEQFGCGTYADNPRGSYVVDPYASYYNTPNEGVIDHQIPREDFIFTAKKRVMGVRLAGEAHADLYDVLAKQNVINDIVGSKPILVWFDPDSQTGTAFVRQIDNRTLTFFADPEDPGILLDKETGSLWNAATGQAVGGTLMGKNSQELSSLPLLNLAGLIIFPIAIRTQSTLRF